MPAMALPPRNAGMTKRTMHMDFRIELKSIFINKLILIKFI